MDILYLLGSGSKWNNNELRFSLRSIARYGLNIRKVFVCGDKPSFLSDMVIFIPCVDKYNAKHKNMLYKIQYAIEHSDIADEFLVSSDDHFYIRETDFDNYPYYRRDYITRQCRTQLPSFIEPNQISPEYTQLLIATKQFLIKHELPVHGFMTHANTHFNKSIFKQMLPLVLESYETDDGVEPTCLMLNYQLTVKPFEYVDRVDVKFRSNVSREHIHKVLGDSECFSIQDEAIESAYPFLINEFPDKCIYENEDDIDWNYNGIPVGSKHKAIIQRYQKKYPACDVWIEGRSLCIRRKGRTGAPTRYTL